MPPGRTWQRADTDDAKDTVLDQLGVIWKQHPNLRLGQLIANVFLDKNSYLFVVEDSDFIHELNQTYGVRHDTETDPL